MRARRSGSRSSAITASASASGSSGGTSTGVSAPSRVPPTSVATCGHAARHRLEQADRERLPARRQHVDVELAQVVRGGRPERLEDARAGRPRRAARAPRARRRRSSTRGARQRWIRGAAASSTSSRFWRRSTVTAPTTSPSAGRRARTARSRCGRPRSRRGRSRFARATVALVVAHADQRGGARAPAPARRRSANVRRASESRRRTGSSAACRPRAGARAARRGARARRPSPRARARGRSRAARAPARPAPGASRCGCGVVAPERQPAAVEHDRLVPVTPRAPPRAAPTCSATPPSGGSQTRAIRATARSRVDP